MTLEVQISRIVFSAFLGILLGLERELKRKPLGLKTCLVISVASCLLTLVSMQSGTAYNTAEFHGTQGVFRADPMRLAAQIVSGVGFLGAGVILRKNNEVISGLTTAAMIWAASGLGIAAGAGFYIDALFCTFLLIVSVEFAPKLIRKLGPAPLREKEAIFHLL